MEEEVLDILRRNLGEYRMNNNSWYSFNCPVCSSMAGVERDNKFNLECRVSQEQGMYYHCWACADTNGTKGNLSKLIKTFPRYEYETYKGIIDNNVNITHLFKKHLLETKEDELEYPVGVRSFDFSEECNALSYLRSRGITIEIIERFRIAYTIDDYTTPRKFRNRIVIPSFDRFGDLNYYVCRDYSGLNTVKFMNPKMDKKSLVVNEHLVDWNKDVILVEGMFDHIVVENSIPLLGKHLDRDFLLYDKLVRNAKSNVIIFLDGDAMRDARLIYRLLNSNVRLKGRVFVAGNFRKDADPSDIFRDLGVDGIRECIKNKYRPSEIEFLVS